MQTEGSEDEAKFEPLVPLAACLRSETSAGHDVISVVSSTQGQTPNPTSFPAMGEPVLGLISLLLSPLVSRYPQEAFRNAGGGRPWLR